MCEKEKFKRKFIMATLGKLENTCMFVDATELFTEDRKCARHGKCCDT